MIHSDSLICQVQTYSLFSFKTLDFLLNCLCSTRLSSVPFAVPHLFQWVWSLKWLHCKICASSAASNQPPSNLYSPAPCFATKLIIASLSKICMKSLGRWQHVSLAAKKVCNVSSHSLKERWSERCVLPFTWRPVCSGTAQLSWPPPQSELSLCSSISTKNYLNLTEISVDCCF